jgi:TolB protein
MVERSKSPPKYPRTTLLRLPSAVLLLVLVFLLAFGLGWLALRAWLAYQDASAGNPDQIAASDLASPEHSPDLSTQVALELVAAIPAAEPTLAAAPTPSADFGVLLASVRWEGRDRILVHWPGVREGKLLAPGDWDDREAVASPDGSQIAFASRRGGHWDLYLLQLATDRLERLTDTPGYEGHPTWSPDGQRLAYEASSGEDFDIWILPLGEDHSPYQLTTHPANDTSPTWGPNGDRIAFVSDRDGEGDIFVAYLAEDAATFQNMTQTPQVEEGDPAFDPTGMWLAYSSCTAGVDLIFLDDLSSPDEPLAIGQGRHPAWSPEGDTIAAILRHPMGTHLVAYAILPTGLPALGQPLADGIQAIAWASSETQLPGSDFLVPLSSVSTLMDADQQASGSHAERTNVVPLEGVLAPDPVLSDRVDEAFTALRSRAGQELGWDFLATLEHAYVGLTVPLPPGYAASDWLYTGRAFAFSEGAMRGGWVEIVREDFGGQTYWRVFVRTRLQDGSLGEPMRGRPWDLSARYSEDPTAYELGGSLCEAIPHGYYVDFTELAADFGFERLPANQNWRTFYYGARFNEFVLKDGLTWEQAMLELYPPSSIATPTPFSTPTPSAR